MIDDGGVMVGMLGGRYFAVLRDCGETVLSASGATAAEALEALEARRAVVPDRGVEPDDAPDKAIATATIENEIRFVVASEGALRNNHIRLTGIMDWFEADAVGGANRDSAAQSQVVVDWDGHPGTETDLDGAKAIFRDRSLIAHFVRDTGLQAGEQVEIRRLAPYRYRLRRLGPV